ncbi:MAG TPA: Ldh family oxidoreductase, partial [Sedimentisphaerales bacterium]|nr:Ldh family oxidoreductase [Sedimentisphaerales bacterium]
LAALHRRLGKSAFAEVQPVLVRESASAAAYTGRNCIGQLAMRFAAKAAAAKARKCGAAVVTMVNTEWVAALSPYVVELAQDGFVAIIWCQSDRARACAPLGGLDAMFSTNPVAFAVPMAGNPIVADFSTTTMSNGAVRLMRQSGKLCEVPRFLDRDGSPSKDPAVIESGGTMMFMGAEADGHKGYALSILNEAMAFMGGATREGDQLPGFQSFTLMVMDPQSFAGLDGLRQRMGGFAEYLKSSRPRRGTDKIRMPGEGGFGLLAEARARGIPLGPQKVEMLRRISEDCGAGMPALTD